jgi:hypothetical protein
MRAATTGPIIASPLVSGQSSAASDSNFKVAARLRTPAPTLRLVARRVK